MPRQNFSTRDISRYEWGATGTIFPSSCYPVSFFAVARPRDLSFAAVRFQSVLLLSLSPSHSSSRRLPCNVPLQPTAQLHHSYSFLDQAFEVDVSSGHISDYKLASLLEFFWKRFESIYRSIRDYSTFLLQFSRISNYPTETSIISGVISPRISVGLSIRQVDNMFRVSAPGH